MTLVLAYTSPGQIGEVDVSTAAVVGADLDGGSATTTYSGDLAFDFGAAT